MKVKNYWLINFECKIDNETVTDCRVVKAKTIDKAIDKFHWRYGDDCIILSIEAYYIEIEKEAKNEG